MSKLKRVLGLPVLTFYGVGMILGAGIYSIIGKATGIAGYSVWQSLLLAAVVAGIAALSYAEMTAMFPKVGGEYVYLRSAFPRIKWVGNSVGLVMSFAGVCTAATVALAFAGYTREFIEIPTFAIAFLLLLVFTIINILGVKESSWMNIVFTLIEAFGLVLFIYFGLQSPKFAERFFTPPTFSTISGSSLIIFAYFGFESIVNFVEETKNPEQTLPRAILLSVCVSTVLYVLVALSALALLPIDELTKSEAPLADAVRPISSNVAGVLGGIALFATANTALISLVTTSRILYGMARDKAVPLVLGVLHEKRKTPWVSAVISFVIACMLLPLERVETLASVSSFATMLAFISVHVALIVLRFREPDRKRPFRTPFSIGRTPILPIIGILITVFLISRYEMTVYIVAGSIIFLFLFLNLLVAFRK